MSAAIPAKSGTPRADAPAAATAVPGSARSRKGEIDDAEAVARAREGDHDAFRVLVERYEGRVRRLCERVLRDEEAARDATQDAFIETSSVVVAIRFRRNERGDLVEYADR